ncbi:hypothetical protein [Clostridium sp. C105KSO13]|uniref:hypothetical protein n=1 Tax=Clostridium sp. C105KSO13 TaxID=1776045 RepID=UPI00074061F3|nr:hypothetical protein [Clostridium sp. C105KSO13]CUX44234.1 hypothetical protein BN3456_02404 [Clostridium sp. C105KSO13]
MNEAEQRRKDLLRQTRKLYNEDGGIPAVHPRYGRIYHDLYGGDEETRPKNSFYFRLILAVLCFVCYIWIDYEKIDVANVNSGKIINQIERQLELKDIKSVWKSL